MIVGRYVLQNGKITPIKEAKLPIFDLGFLRGYGVCQVMEAYRGVIFRPEERIKTLFDYCKKALIDIKNADYIQKLPDLLAKLIKENGLENERVFVRADVTAGLTADSFNPDKNSEPNCFAFCFSSALKKEPLKLFTYKYEKPFPEIKKSQDYFLAQVLLKNSPFDDVLYLSKENNVLETSRKNIFMIKDGIVKTPSEGILKGMTRNIVLNILKASREFEIRETKISLDEIYLSDEVFITSTSYGVFPVGQVDKKKFKEGVATKKISGIYSDYKKSYYKKIGVRI